jgi:serine/threonine protein kinase
MPATRKDIKKISHPDDARPDEGGSWSFTPGDEIVPGVHAWALLGDGRRCETWLAWCIWRWAPVAIKLPRPDCINERTSQALSREANTVASLMHPAIQRLLEAHGEEPLPYLVFEYVDGPTLADLLDEKGRLAPGDVVRLGMQLASALHYIHGRGVVHCDLKPTNLALRDGRAVLIDFDIARQIGESGTGTKAPGSVQYMAPEQSRGDHAVPSMDLFALGATLYEAATDVIAFDSETEESGRVYRQLTQRPALPRSIDPAIPEALEHIIWILLDPDPQRRPPTAMAVLALLARALPPGEQGLWPEWATGIIPATQTSRPPACRRRKHMATSMGHACMPFGSPSFTELHHELTMPHPHRRR